METKNYSMNKSKIDEQRKSIPYTETWFITVSKKQLLQLYEIMEEMVDAFDKLEKENTLLQYWIKL